MSERDPSKPLGAKAYGNIPHLSGSRLGPKDYRANPGHELILTVKARKGDTILVEEKLDGSCCAVTNIGGEIVPMSRAGYRAETSPYRQHHVFAAWVYARQDRFARAIEAGDRLVGEWVLQAHGIRYAISNPDLLFRPFDLMRGTKRAGRKIVERICSATGLSPAPLLHMGAPIPVAKALELLQADAEGAVWRCENERFGVETLAKFVRSDKVDGLYLPSVTGGSSVEVWNFPPELAAVMEGNI